MRLSVDGAALSDPRFRKLGKAMNITWQEAIARCLAVWLVCYDRRTPLLLTEDVDIIAEKEGFSAGMIAANLAVKTGKDGLRVRGVNDRIDFLLRQVERGKASGVARRGRAASEPMFSARSVAPEPTLDGAANEGRANSSSGALASATAQASALGESAAGAARPATRNRKTKATRKPNVPIPENWRPNDRARSLAAELGVDCEREAVRFRGNAAARDQRWADWDAAFNNWLRKAPEFATGNRAPSSRVGRVEPRPADEYPATGDISLEAS